MNYDDLYEEALRNVVHAILTRVAKEGLLGEHHFYISFLTNDDGVSIPDSLRDRYPDEMTIVMQNQFWNLVVTDDGFEVELSFNNLQERVVVPFAAITSFVDPSVRFGLQARGEREPGSPETAPEEDAPQPQLATAIPEEITGGETVPDPTEDDTTAEVIPLDNFRKK